MNDVGECCSHPGRFKSSKKGNYPQEKKDGLTEGVVRFSVSDLLCRISLWKRFQEDKIHRRCRLDFLCLQLWWVFLLKSFSVRKWLFEFVKRYSIVQIISFFFIACGKVTLLSWGLFRNNNISIQGEEIIL